MVNRQLRGHAPHAGPRCSGLERVKADSQIKRERELFPRSRFYAQSHKISFCYIRVRELLLNTNSLPCLKTLRLVAQDMIDLLLQLFSIEGLRNIRGRATFYENHCICTHHITSDKDYLPHHGFGPLFADVRIIRYHSFQAA